MKVPPPMDENGTRLPNIAVTPGSSHEDKSLLVDASITNNRTVRFRTKPAGAAAKTRTQEKCRHYGGKYDPSSYTLLPFVAELDGTLCAPAHAFIRAAAVHQSANSDGAWLQSDCVRLWRQSVSIRLQGAISQSVLRSIQRPVRIPGQPEPDWCAYQRVRLLRPTHVNYIYDT